MNNHVSIITLGVKNFPESLKFHEALFDKGLNGGDVHGYPESINTPCATFFELDGGITLGLFPLEALAADATVSCDTGSFSGMSIAHNTKTNKEVDEVIEQARAIGAKIVKEPENVFWGGYSGYFSDPNGYLWEVASHENIEKLKG